METLRFADLCQPRPRAVGVAVETNLTHFAIITYMVDPELLRRIVPPRFQLDKINYEGREYALVSAVPFLDTDFAFVLFPWKKWSFGQLTFRVYTTDLETGEHVAFFIGTALDSIFVSIPKYWWGLPWHRAKMEFRTDYDRKERLYKKYQMMTRSEWGNARLAVRDSGKPPENLIGFPDVETGLVLLTHPLKGYFRGSNGSLGMYSIWHPPIPVTEAKPLRVEFDLLDRMGLVERGDLAPIHSILLQPKTRFTVYLPPKKIG